MLRSRNSGGRLMNSRPRSMHAGGTIKSTPRKMRGGGTSVRSKLGVSYGPPGGALSPFGSQGPAEKATPQGDNSGNCVGGDNHGDSFNCDSFGCNAICCINRGGQAISDCENAGGEWNNWN
jgi:hypothetical protein